MDSQRNLTVWLEGWVSVRAALAANNRDVFEVLLEAGKGSDPLLGLARRAERAGVPLRYLPRADLDALAESQTHGGALARVGPRRFLPLDALGRGTAPPFLFLLDGVEDPYNFGQAVRAMHAAGAHGLVLRPRNWTSAAGVVTRASAGSSEFLPMAVAEDDAALLAFLRARGIRLVCAEQSPDAHPLYQADLRGPLLLAVGGERRGVAKALRAQADLKVYIPYGRDFRQALGAAPSAAVLAFEVLRQRQFVAQLR
jgi:23S rRNA (guanosine2251-2'-O)-methyltransferase